VKILVYVAIFMLLVVGYVKYLESRGIYFPTKNIEFTPQLVALAFKDVYFKTEDNIQINGWFIPNSNAKYTLLFCHGNAGNIGHRLEKIAMFNKMNLNVFIFDYRGYGKSIGRPSESGIYLDVKAAYDYLIRQLQMSPENIPENIILYGESLGCAVAINLAAAEKVGALIAEGAFSKGRDMARHYYPFLPSFLFANTFDCLTKIKKVSVPKLFIHSRNDEIVPFKLAKKLYVAAGETKYFAELQGDHNSAFLSSQDMYISSIISFIEKL
jgi:hypothetical protein